MTDPVADIPESQSSSVDTGVKIATLDLIQLTGEESVPVEVMTDLLFEDIGGQEIINISRHDIVNGQDVLYQPIKNLTSLQFQYNPQNILALQNTSDAYFKNFPIKFNTHVPDVGTGPNGEIVYLESETGNIIINVINLAVDEQVEVQILSAGTMFNDTIYEVNL